MGAGTTDRTGYISELDGLRAVAVLAVVAFHSGLPLARGGFLGVSLFFTISGFLITRLLLAGHERDGGIRIGRFWERRVRRLAPAALLTIVAVGVAAPHFADASQLSALRGDAFGALGYAANWRFLARGIHYADLFGGPSPLLHFWSLAIEEQFYVVFPLLVAGVLVVARGRRRALRTAFGALFVASVVLQLTLGDVNRVYLGTDTRAAELLAGALLALALDGRVVSGVARRVAPVVSLAALATLAYLSTTLHVDGDWITHGGLAGIAVLNALVVGGAVIGASTLALFRWRPLVALGAVSYGIYLFHWPVIVFVDERHTGLHGAQLAFVRIGVVAVAAVASYHLVECPIRYGRVLASRPRLVSAFAGVVAVAMVAAIIGTANRPPALVDPSVVKRLATDEIAARPPVRVMFVGDETGTDFARGLASDPVRFTVDDATRRGCPLVPSAWTRQYSGDTPRDTRSCRDVLSRWLTRAHAFKPDLIVVMATNGETADHASPAPDHWSNDVLTGLADGTAPRYLEIANALRFSGAVVAWATVPHYTVAADQGVRRRAYFDDRVEILNEAIARTTTTVSGVTALDFATHVDHADGGIDLGARPDGLHFAPAWARAAGRGWFADALVDSYRQARHELGLDVSAPVTRVLVAGDSTSLNLAAGLMEYGRDHGNLVVEWGGNIGCPIVPVVKYQMVADQHTYADACPDFFEMWRAQGKAFRPDVVLVVSSFAEAADMWLPGSGGPMHLGDARYDMFFASQLDAMADAVASSGARLAVASAPREQSMTAADTDEVNGRLRALNNDVAALARRRPHVVVVPLAGRVDRPDGAVDTAARPDGVHFTLAAARAVVDAWLASTLLHAARGV